jgi:DNA-binding protein H-NS
MANINLEKMALKDLLDLETRLQRAIAVARERERSEIKQRVENLVQNAGFSVTELFGGRGSLKGRTVAAKYQNPENKNETWTGRGRKPRWLTAKLDKGAKLEDFALR